MAALRRDFEKPLFYFCSQERKAGEFHSRCLLQCYCQESHLQEVRQVAGIQGMDGWQVERNKLVCYFPHLQQQRER